MKKIEETKHTHEFRLEEVIKMLTPEHTPGVDVDNVTMRLKDGNTVLVLELTSTTVK